MNTTIFNINLPEIFSVKSAMKLITSFSKTRRFEVVAFHLALQASIPTSDLAALLLP